jgi:hypothetical protein
MNTRKSKYTFSTSIFLPVLSGQYKMALFLLSLKSLGRRTHCGGKKAMKLFKYAPFMVMMLAGLGLSGAAGCVAVEIERGDNIGISGADISPRQREPHGDQSVITQATPPISQLSSERLQGIRFVHYACTEFPQNTGERGFDGQPFIEFGVSHTFGDMAVQPYLAYRCD